MVWLCDITGERDHPLCGNNNIFMYSGNFPPLSLHSTVEERRLIPLVLALQFSNSRAHAIRYVYFTCHITSTRNTPKEQHLHCSSWLKTFSRIDAGIFTFPQHWALRSCCQPELSVARPRGRENTVPEPRETCSPTLLTGGAERRAGAHPNRGNKCMSFKCFFS